MEAIGVLGSVIAIGQALAALPKIIDTLKSIGDFKGDYANLLNELATLRALQSQTEIATARFVASHDTSLTPPGTTLLLENTKEQLNFLIKDLESLAQSCHHQKSRRRSQIASVVKWQWSRKRVTNVYQLANKCRNNLHMAMTMLLLHGQSAQAQLLMEVHSVTTTVIPRIKDNMEHIQKTTSNEQSQAERQDTVNLTKACDGPETASSTSAHFFTMKTRVHLACGYCCRCRCHASRTEFTSPPWLKSFLGSLFLSYSGQPIFRGRDETISCDQETCRGHREPGYLHYYFPDWLWRRAVLFTASRSSLSGYGATLYMTIPRILDKKADIWYHIMYRDTRKTALWIKEHGVLPGDRFDTGLTLLSYPTHKGYYDVIECCLQAWPRSVVQRCYDRNTYAFMERELFLGRVPSEAQSTLKNLLYLWDEQLEPLDNFEPQGQEEIHLDERLQHVCLTGDVRETKSLISAGADINSYDFEGKTPLHLALSSKNYDCTLALLDSGCDMSAKEDMFGNTPLAYAFEGLATPELFQVLSRLVPETASSYKTMFGCTAMHELSRLQGETHLQEIFQLLMDAGQDIEARHEDGQTPLLTTVSRNNSAVFRILASAEASLTALDCTNRSILHYAALVADAEFLRCLIKAEIAVDIDLRDSGGFTALDNFRYCQLADTVPLFASHWRRPNKEETLLFEVLLRTVRDRYLGREISRLESVLPLLVSNKLGDACQLVDGLMKEKIKYHKLEELRTIRVIKDLQIRQGMVDDAFESVQEIIEVHTETMATSPFSQPSVFDGKYNEREGGNGNGNGVVDLSTVSLPPCGPMVDWNFC